MLLLLTGCLFNSDNPLYSDLDGDGFSVADGDCIDDRPLVQGPIVLGNDEFDTLQLALDTAAAGETVIVCPGSYPAVTVPDGVTLEGRPEGGDVIIDAGGAGSAVTVVGQATLIGLTIQGGTGKNYSGNRYGGGVDAVQGNYLEMRDCLVADNAADIGGGVAGPQAAGSTTVLDNVRLRDNYAQFFGGGGLFFDTVTGTRVVSNRNQSDGAGGGIALVESVATFDEIIFLENAAADFGGGLLVADGTVTVTGADFTSNAPDDIGFETPGGAQSGTSAPGASFTCDATSSSPSCG